MAGNSKTSFDEQVLDTSKQTIHCVSSLEVSSLQRRSQQLSVGGARSGCEDAPLPQLEASSKERGTDGKLYFRGN